MTTVADLLKTFACKHCDFTTKHLVLLIQHHRMHPDQMRPPGH